MSTNNSFSTENQLNLSTAAENQAEDQSSKSITLKELNDIQARIYYGADILFASLMLPGIIGNLHVLHIYIYKKPVNNTRVYVLFLAIIDLLSCALVYPFNIANCLLPYMYYDNISCKIFLFLNVLATLGSAFALLVIAIERYRKICTPFKTQITIKYAKLSCLLVVVVTGIFSIPILFLFGSTPIQTFEPGYYGYECHYVNEYKDTLFQLLYSGGTLFLTVCLSIAMIILYSLIGLHLWRQNKKMNKNKKSKKQAKARQAATALIRDKLYLEDSKTDGTTIETTETTNNFDNGETSYSNQWNDDLNGIKSLNATNKAYGNKHQLENIHHDGEAGKFEPTNPKTKDKLHMITEMDEGDDHIESINHKTAKHDDINEEMSKKEPAYQQLEDKKVRTDPNNQLTDNKADLTKLKAKATRKIDKADQIKRTSYMFFLITLCFLISYISHPFLRLYQVLNMDWYASLNLPSLISFHTALVTLYINNAANSFIYTLCDSHYRQEIKAFYGRLLCCRKQG